MNNKDQIVKDFNDLTLELALNISYLCPTSLIGVHIKEIEKMIKNPTFFYKFIDLFCAKVLKYKEQIDNGSEDFFLKENYEKDLEEYNAKFKRDDIINHVFKFKSIWQTLDIHNKNVIITFMKYLGNLAEEYFKIALLENNY
jgi:hypothetical protein